MSTTFEPKPSRQQPAVMLPEYEKVTKLEFRPAYFAVVELVEASGHKQDAFDIVHDAYITMVTTVSWNPAERPFREQFLICVRDELKAFRVRRRKERDRRHIAARVTAHYENEVIPFVGSVQSPEDQMIAREEREEDEQWLLEKRAQIRKLQRCVAHDPVALKLLEHWSTDGGDTPLPQVAKILNVSLAAIYTAKKLIERHAHRIIVENQGDDS